MNEIQTDLITELNRVLEAKEAIRAIMVANGVVVDKDSLIDAYPAAIEETLRIGGSPFAVYFGTDIYPNYPNHMTKLQNDKAYYDSVLEDVEKNKGTDNYFLKAYIQETGLKHKEFKEKIAWWPKGQVKSAYGVRSYFNLVEINDPTYNANNSSKYFFADCPNLKFVTADFSNAQDAEYMFSNCASLENVFGDFDFIADARSMFENCRCLREFDKSVASLKNCNYMFKGCVSLKRAIINSDDITSATEMFNGCTSLEEVEINIQGARLNNSAISKMFNGCTNLKDAKITNWGNYDLDLSNSLSLSVESVHRIITGTIGVYARKLILHPNVIRVWQASDFYEGDITEANKLKITVTSTGQSSLPNFTIN